MNNNALVFASPAKKWDEALPLGNGRLGAMIFGEPELEKIQLNEDSIWSGDFRDRNNPAAKEALPEIRRLLNEERVKEAEELCLEALTGAPSFQRVYQTAGELYIGFSPNGNFGHPWSGIRSRPLLSDVKNYRRELDFSNALHSLSFEHEETFYKRECFISAEAELLVLKFSAENKDGKPQRGKISFRAWLDRGIYYDRKGNIEDAAFLARDTDIPFCAVIKAVQKGGSQRSRGGFITVESADEAMLFLDIQSGFREKNCEAACLKNISRAAAMSWEQLFESHIKEHGYLYDRMKLELQNDEKTNRYFNFCRYLLMSCSRPGTLPANLQGLWNEHIDPPWGCDYTININTQMNYWAANMCNLSETELPLFDLLERMHPNGKKTAAVMYGCRGFTCHHNTNIWADTAPRDCWIPASYWTLGAAWLSLHIFEHYEYTHDREFLKKHFYLLNDACIFFVDFLVEAKTTNSAGKHHLIVSPSSSPENSYLLNGEPVCLCAGCEMDNQILRKLFQSAIKAAEILGITNFDREQFHSVLERIPDTAINTGGTIREWNANLQTEEYDEAEPGHRHFSHLWALYPGDSITPDETPQLAAAARKSIESRLSANGGHTGWSRSWLINFFARLNDGEAAITHLNALYNDFTLPNLFNSHPPFQIDGNFGSLSGITQMLIQSRTRYNDYGFTVVLDILPALPNKWACGYIKGVRAKGNLEIDFSWEKKQLGCLLIKNKGTEEVKIIIRWDAKIHECILQSGQIYKYE